MSETLLYLWRNCFSVHREIYEEKTSFLIAIKINYPVGHPVEAS